MTLPKPGKDSKCIQNLHLISLLPTTGKLLEKVMLKIFQRHIEETGLRNASQFGLHARLSMTLHFMKFTDYVALNFRAQLSCQPSTNY
jgi:hypothetical protein